MDAVTICAVNYLPFANILGESFLEHHPSSNFSILVVDGATQEFEFNKKFDLILPAQLELDHFAFEQMAVYYDVTELSTALKPSVLKHLLLKGRSKVIYLDPDIQVFSNLSVISKELENFPLVLTPHFTKPYPDDDLKPSYADIMGSGIYNLGFIGVSNSNQALTMLNWWEERLRFDSIAAPEQMLFTDQRWIDLVPSFFNCKILQNPEFNVAYWNLHERNLIQNSGKYFVNGIPLGFFHFSGYRPDKPWILSKYVADSPRITISSSVHLRQICADYGELAKKFGWVIEGKVPYGYSKFSDGTQIYPAIRKMYRQLCIDFHKDKIQDLPGPDAINDWLRLPTESSGNLGRVLFELWNSRPDLQRAFPDAPNKDAMEFVNWARSHGIRENEISEDFIYFESDSADVIKSNQAGLNISGYLAGEFGVGQSARLIALACEETGLKFRTLVSKKTVSRQTESFNERNINEIYPVTISVVNADQFELWVNDVGREVSKFSKVIGVWAWEIEDFPSRMHKAFSHVDEVWAVSSFVQKAIAKHTYKPVKVIPTPVITPTVSESLDRQAIGIPLNREYNLFIFDYLSVFNRKNPLGAVLAHMTAFPNQDGPLLIIKSMNGEKFAESRELLRYQVKDRTDILLIEDYLTRPQLTSLMNECSAYVSLHRSEGYGLTISEAMALGKPVITTAYSGNMDLCNEEVCFLVPYKLVNIGEGSFPYPPESFWAEPDLSYATRLMKDLHGDPDLAAEVGSKAKLHITNTFTLERASEFIKSRVKYQLSLKAKVEQNFFRALWILKTLAQKIAQKIK